jgi:hypothetical protein
MTTDPMVISIRDTTEGKTLQDLLKEILTILISDNN